MTQHDLHTVSAPAELTLSPVTYATKRGLPRVSVIVPTLNEAANLPHVLPRIPGWVEEVLIVDGGSTDGTVEVARRLHPGVRIVVERTKGKGAALQRGFRESTGDIIVTIDADGSTDPGEIPRFVAALLNGADYAKGSRFVQGGGTDDMELYRRIGNAGLRVAARMAFGGRYTDLCYGYNAFWRRVLPALLGEVNGFEIETYMNVRVLAAGVNIVEVASHEHPRIHGTSNLRSFRDGTRVLRTIVTERIRLGRRARQELAAQMVVDVAAEERWEDFLTLAHAGAQRAEIALS